MDNYEIAALQYRKLVDYWNTQHRLERPTMNCTSTRITTLKQYEQAARKLNQDLTELHQMMRKEKTLINQLTQICNETIDQEPTIQCPNCQSNNTINYMGVMYSRFRTRQTSHTPYYSVCNNCGKVITPTEKQKLELAQFVSTHPTRYNSDQTAEAHYYLHKHSEEEN